MAAVDEHCLLGAKLGVKVPRSHTKMVIKGSVSCDAYDTKDLWKKELAARGALPPLASPQGLQLHAGSCARRRDLFTCVHAQTPKTRRN